MVDRVTGEIRRYIVSGELPPGQEFSLRQIATRLGVSFIPVREALRVLEAEGLLETRPGRSALVSPLDADELRSLVQLRRQIEPDLAVRAAGLMPRAELDRLEALLAALADPAVPSLDRHDLRHELRVGLVAPAASTWDLRILERLWRAMERYLCIGESAQEADELPPAWDVGPERALLAAYRSGGAGAVRAASQAAIAVAERLARRGLTVQGRAGGDAAHRRGVVAKPTETGRSTPAAGRPAPPTAPADLVAAPRPASEE